MTNFFQIFKGVITFFLLSIYTKSTFAQAVANFEWVKTVGGISYDETNSVTTDAAGNIYKTGSIQGTVDIDPSAATLNLVAAGADVVITKFSPSGNLIWAKSMGSTATDVGINIVADNYGHIYIAGDFSGTVDFDPGPGIANLTSTTGSVFLLKLDTSGNYIWAKKMSTSSYNKGMSLTIDPASGNLVVTGAFTATTDFGTINLTSNGSRDLFLTKIDTAGNFLWAKNIGGTGADQSTGNVSGIDLAGNIYLGGSFTGTVDFNPGAGVTSLTAQGGDDGFVAKFNSAGDFIWVKQFGGSAADEVTNVKADKVGNVYCVGSFSNTIDADPNAAVLDFVSVGNRDIFVVKLDTAGNFIWAKQLAGTGTKVNTSLAIDSNNHIYFSGRGYGTSLDVDPGQSTYMVNGGEFTVKLNSSGNFVWATNINGHLAVDNSKNVYVTGSFELTKDFNPGSGVTNRTSNGLTDIFLLKLNQNCGVFDFFFEFACDSFTYNGITYTTSGNYSQLFYTAQGCDSTMYINLTISQSYDSLTTASACGSYHFLGMDYTTSGIYVHNYTTASGCDSLMTLDLTIFNTIYGDTTTVVTCNSYEFNGQVYNSTGVYTQTYNVSTGCDSIVTLDLTINNADISVTQSGTTLTSNASNATYQWINCNDGNTPIVGAESQSFTSNIDGSYAVIVTQNGCSDTSDCYTVEHGTNITELGKNNFVNIFPNPSKGLFTIHFSQNIVDAECNVYNTIGQVLKSQTIKNGTTAQFDISAFATGIYYLKIADARHSAWLKVIKQ